ncbi:MAG: type VI secretion protein, partial [Pseudoxanthomonas suwonensis]
MTATHAKWLFAIAMLFLAIVAGLYMAGFITIQLLGVDATPGLKTWPAYLQKLDTPAGMRYANKIKLGGIVGLGLPLLGWLLMLVPLSRAGGQRSTHGNARFAHKSELAKGGMLKPAGNGIVVGKAG